MTSDKLFIPADSKRWIAENLLRGGGPDGLTEILAKDGFSRNQNDQGDRTSQFEK